LTVCVKSWLFLKNSGKKFQEKNQNLQWQQHDDWLRASADAPPFLLAPSTTTSTPHIKLDTSSVHLENQNPKNNIPLKKKGIDDSLHLWISSVYACMHSLSNKLWERSATITVMN
jgi:hypothetical protein